MTIQSNKPLAYTCCVCGQPAGNVLVSLPAATGKGPLVCKSCGETACAKHYSKSKQLCVRCAAGKESFCRTPRT
jgi:hypothetical protein